MEQLNNVDVIILICIAISMVVAFIRGFIKEILSICGLAIFVYLTVCLTPLILPTLTKYIESKLLAQFVIFLTIMAVFYAIWIISTDKLIEKIRKSTLSFMDRLFGLIFGFLRAVLILGFCFLLVKIILPEELKDKDSILKKSKYFMMAEGCSDFIELLLPKSFIEDSVKSVEKMNKVQKKTDKKEDVKQNQENKKTDLPSKLDQEQMDKMFELLVKPEIKNNNGDNTKVDKQGYSKNDTSSLDRLIDITSE